MDLGRTLAAPSNQLRVLKAQLELTARAIGSLFIPALQAILPPAIAVVTVIREVIQALAALVGFTMPDFTIPDDTNYGSIVSGVDSIGDSASKAAKEMNYLIGGFDELNVMNKDTGSGGSGSAGGIGNILGDIELPEYDMFKDYVANQVDAIANKIKQTLKKIKDQINTFLPLLKGIATAFATAFATKKLLEFFKEVKNGSKFLKAIRVLFEGVFTAFKSGGTLLEKISNGFKVLWTNFTGFMQGLSPITQFAVAMGALAGEFVTVSSATEEFYLGNINLASAVGQSAIAIGLATAALTALYGPIGLVVSGFTAFTAILFGAYDAQKQLNSAVTESLLYNNGGVKIQEVADAYTNYTNKITESVSYIHEQTDAYKENQNSIEGIIEQINVWQQEMSLDSSKIVENTVLITNSFDELQSTITSNLQIAQDALLAFGQVNAETFAKAGVDVNEYNAQVNEATRLSIEGYESMFAELSELAKLQQSDPYNISYQDQYNEKLGDLFEILGYNLTASTDLKDKLDFSGIDFTSLDSLETALGEVTGATSATITELQSSRDELILFADEISRFSPELGEGMKEKINSVFDWTVADVQVQSQATIDWLKGQYNSMVSEAAGGITISQEDADSAMTKLLLGIGSGNASDDAKVLASIKINSYMVEGVDKAFSDAQETLDGIFKESANTSVNAYAEQIKSESGYSQLKTIGQYINEGVVAGMEESGVSSTYNYVDSFVNGIKGAFGIHSPSTVMRDEVGVYLAEGVVLGMKDGFSDGVDTVINELSFAIDSSIAPLFSYDKWVLIFQNVNNAAKQKTTDAINEWKVAINGWINNDVKTTFSESAWLIHFNGIVTAFKKIQDQMLKDWRVFSEELKQEARKLENIFQEVSENIINNWNDMGDELLSGLRSIISDLQDYADSHPIIIEVITKEVGGVSESSSRSSRMSAYSVPALAKGGVLTSPSLVMAGEYRGAQNNPEIVAPQSIIQETIDESNAAVVNALERLILIAEEIASKDTVLEIDGDELGRSVERNKRSKGYNLGVSY